MKACVDEETDSYASFGELLVTPRTFCQAHKLLCTKEAMESQYPRIKGLEPAILCTCRSIYFQALPNLYGSNNSKFDSPESLTEFAHEELNNPSAFQNARYGRLPMIRYVVIELRKKPFYRHIHQNLLWREWKNTSALEGYGDNMGHPSLLGIALDFSDWELGLTNEHEINASSVL